MASDVRPLSCQSESDSLYSFTSVVLPRRARASVRHSAACWLRPLGVSAWIRLSFCVWPSASALRSGGGGGGGGISKLRSLHLPSLHAPPRTLRRPTATAITARQTTAPAFLQRLNLNPTHSPATPLPSQASLCSTNVRARVTTWARAPRPTQRPRARAPGAIRVRSR